MLLGRWPSSLLRNVFIRRVLQHAPLACSVVALGTGLMVLYTLRQPLLYRSTASVLIETGDRSGAGAGAGRDGLTPDAGKAQRVLAESSPVIARLSELSGETLRGASPHKPLPADFETRIDGQLLFLQVDDGDAERAARLANAWVEAFAEEVSRRAPSYDVKKVLDKTVPQLREEWIARQEALGKFERETKFVASEFERSPIWRTVDELSTRLNTKNMEVAVLLAERDLMVASKSPEEILELPRAKTDAALMSYRKLLEDRRTRLADARESFKPGSQQYAAAEENVQVALRDLQQATQALTRQVGLEVEKASMERDRLGALLKEAQKQLDELKTKSAAHKVLSAEAAMAERLYLEMARRKGEADVSGSFEYFYAVPWDKAAPTYSPVSPNWPRNIVLGFVVSLFVAIGLVRVIEMLDDTVKLTPGLGREIGVAPIAVLPTGRATKSLRESFSLGLEKGSALSQALHNLLSELELRRDTLLVDQALSVVVTSAGPGEGKSFLAGNLAAVCAQTGKRVLLVDADARGQGLSRAFQLSKAPGFFDALLNNSAMPLRLAPGPVPNWTLLPSGTPKDLTWWRTVGLERLLQQLQREFEVIIFDTPPALGRPEASALARRCDVTLLISRSGLTRTADMESAAAKLKGGEASRLYLVFNGAHRMEAALHLCGAAVRE